MKKSISIMAITALLLTPASGVFAQQTTQQATVKAEVVSQFALSMQVFRQDGLQTNGDPILVNTTPTMDNGILTNVDSAGSPTNNALYGKTFHVFLGPVANGGTQYTVKSTMAALATAGGTHTLPHSIGVFGISAKDGTGASVGTLAVGTGGDDAVGTDKLLYTSTATGNSATIELVYGYSGGQAVGTPFPGWQPTPPDQPAGQYQSTVTYTLTA